MSSITIGGSGGGGGRTALAALTNYYISTLGSDSNPGTLAQPWATIQHGMDFIAHDIDFSGFDILANIGAGSFAGFGIKSTVGGGNLVFLGAGSGLTTITAGPNDGIYNFGECISFNVICSTAVGINQVKFVPRSNSSFGSNCVAVYQPGCFCYLADPVTPTAVDIVFDLSDGALHTALIEAEAPSIIQPVGGLAGTYTVVGGGSTIDNLIDLTGQSVCFFGETWSVTGALTVTVGVVNCTAQSIFINQGGPFTGAGVLGPRFNVDDNSSMLSLADPAGTFFPGSIPGVINSGGQYSGISDYNGNVAGLPTATVRGARAVVTDALAPVFGAIVAGGGAVLTPVIADGTNWRWG